MESTPALILFLVSSMLSLVIARSKKRLDLLKVSSKKIIIVILAWTISTSAIINAINPEIQAPFINWLKYTRINLFSDGYRIVSSDYIYAAILLYGCSWLLECSGQLGILLANNFLVACLLILLLEISRYVLRKNHTRQNFKAWLLIIGFSPIILVNLLIPDTVHLASMVLVFLGIYLLVRGRMFLAGASFSILVLMKFEYIMFFIGTSTIVAALPGKYKREHEAWKFLASLPMVIGVPVIYFLVRDIYYLPNMVALPVSTIPPYQENFLGLAGKAFALVEQYPQLNWLTTLMYVVAMVRIKRRLTIDVKKSDFNGRLFNQVISMLAMANIFHAELSMFSLIYLPCLFAMQDQRNVIIQLQDTRSHDFIIALIVVQVLSVVLLGSFQAPELVQGIIATAYSTIKAIIINTVLVVSSYRVLGSTPRFMHGLITRLGFPLEALKALELPGLEDPTASSEALINIERKKEREPAVLQKD